MTAYLPMAAGANSTQIQVGGSVFVCGRGCPLGKPIQQPIMSRNQHPPKVHHSGTLTLDPDWVLTAGWSATSGWNVNTFSSYLSTSTRKAGSLKFYLSQSEKCCIYEGIAHLAMIVLMRCYFCLCSSGPGLAHRQFPPICRACKQNHCRQNPPSNFPDIVWSSSEKEALESEQQFVKVLAPTVSDQWAKNKTSLAFFTIKLTFGIKLDGVTVRLSAAPWAVEDGSSLCDVSLCRVGLGSSDHHTRTTNMKQREKACCKSTGLHFPNHRILVNLRLFAESLLKVCRFVWPRLKIEFQTSHPTSFYSTPASRLTHEETF